MAKKKVLLSSEYSKMGTGYGNMAREMMSGLLKRGFDVVEYASGCSEDDPSRFSMPWQVIPSVPARANKAEWDKFERDPQAKHGSLYFDKACLAFRPDVVIDGRDFWYYEHINTSVCRPYFSFIAWPTMDSRPCRPEWLWQLDDADLVNVYTHFGKKTVQEECLHAKLGEVCPNGVDSEFFEFAEKYKGKDKEIFRRRYGLPENAIIATFVSRNQPRKLFPNVIECIDDVIAAVGESFYFHFHTSYPDIGAGSWDFPLFLGRVKHKDHILFTYVCQKCKRVRVAPFCDGIIACDKCNGPMYLPCPQTGHVQRSVLKEIMYAADFALNPAIGGGQECFNPLSRMKLQNGFKPIKDVVVGDLVATHKGRSQRVLNVMQREYSGEMYHIRSYGVSEETNVTPNHPLYIYRDGEFQWIAAKDVRIGDYTVDAPCFDFSGSSGRFKLECPDGGRHALLDGKITRDSQYIEQYLPQTPEMYHVMGLYLSQGCISRNDTIMFSINNSKVELMEAIRAWYASVSNQKFGVHSGRGCKSLQVCSKPLTSLFHKLFGTGSRVKFIGDEVLSSTKANLAAFVRGMYDGDGWIPEDCSIIEYKTASYSIAYTLRDILAKFGITCSIRPKVQKVRPNDDETWTYYSISINRVPDIVLFMREIYGKVVEKAYNANFSHDYTFVRDGLIFNRVRAIRVEDYSGPVYNVEVENDNSYSICGYLAHNCGIAEHKALMNPMLSISWAGMHDQGYDTASGLSVEQIKDRSNWLVPPYDFAADCKSYMGALNFNVAYYPHEPESCQRRALVDERDMTNKIVAFAQLCRTDKWPQLQKEAFESANSMYRWDRTVDIFAKQIEQLPFTQDRWNSPAPIRLDPQAIVRSIMSQSIEKQVDAFHSVAGRYMRFQPEFLCKLATEMQCLSRYKTKFVSRRSVGIENLEQAYQWMAHTLDSINKFNDARCKRG